MLDLSDLVVRILHFNLVEEITELPICIKYGKKIYLIRQINRRRIALFGKKTI